MLTRPFTVGGVNEEIRNLEGRVAPTAVLPVDGGPGIGAADKVADVRVAATETQRRLRPPGPSNRKDLCSQVIHCIRPFRPL